MHVPMCCFAPRGVAADGSHPFQLELGGRVPIPSRSGERGDAVRPIGVGVFWVRAEG